MPVEYSPSITSARIIPSLLRCPPERGKISMVLVLGDGRDQAAQFADQPLSEADAVGMDSQGDPLADQVHQASLTAGVSVLHGCTRLSQAESNQFNGLVCK